MKLLLHFDVNKTIFMADPVSNKSNDNVIMTELASDPKYKDYWYSKL